MQFKHCIGTYLNLMLQDNIRVLLHKHLVGDYVKGWDDLLGTADQLAVQLKVEPLQVLTVDLKEWNLQDTNLKTNKQKIRE